MFLQIVLIIFGFILLIGGANLLIKGYINIAKRFHISEIIIGLTIVALGTSAPELLVTITSANKDVGDLIIGNAFGSNLCNLLLILGIMAVLKPIKVDKEAKLIHIPVLFVVNLIILLLGYTKNIISKTEGIIIVVFFILYFSYPIIKHNANNVGAAISRLYQKDNLFVSILFILLGIVLLKTGGDLVVENSINIANTFNISEKIIGLTIIAFGTSLPELVTSIVASIKGDEDLAVGNLVGSCIFNLLLILGIGAIINPLKVSNEFIIDIFILIASTLLIWGYCFIGEKDNITRRKGLILLIFFFVYLYKTCV